MGPCVNSTLIENIRLGKKWLALTNALAYYIVPLITAAKSFIAQTTDHSECCIEPWTC